MRSSRNVALALAAALAILVLAVVVKATAAPQQTLPIRVVAVDKKTVKQEKQTRQQLHTLARLIAKQQTGTWKCQAASGTPRTRASVSVWALPTSVPYRKWVLTHWKAQKAGCAKALQRRTIPLTNDWLTSVRLVQRIYPGTESWLRFISHREGGWGGFVMNHQGSGAGGQMQFMASTYYAYNDRAFADARARGFIVDQSLNDWHAAFGQALTAGFMRYTHLDGCHWCL